jgi:hypothetical protein
MGILPKKKAQSRKRINFLYREDLRHMDKITKEVTLLCKYKIDTTERLSLFKQALTEEIAALTGERKTLRNVSRRVNCAEENSEVKAKISALTKRLGELRKEVGLCDDIAARNVEMKGKIKRAGGVEKPADVKKNESIHRGY